MATKPRGKQKALLRQLAEEAWEAELNDELEELFESFTNWADKGLSAFELSEQIHEFHNGIARELYKRYTGDPAAAVARAIARGFLGEEALTPELRAELMPLITYFQENDSEEVGPPRISLPCLKRIKRTGNRPNGLQHMGINHRRLNAAMPQQ
jgi:hypothetical protein